MCIQKTTYSCRHSKLQQLPCDNTKKAKKCSWFRFGPAKPAEPVPCYRRYEWKLKESCSECRMFMLEGVTLDDLREAQKQRAQGYVEPVQPHRHYATPQPIGGIHAEPEASRTGPRFATPKPVGGIYSLPPPAQDAGDSRPESSHYESSIYSDVTNLPGYYDVPNPVQASRVSTPDSYFEPGVNAQVASLPGYYDVSAPVTRAPRPDSHYEPEVNAQVANLPGYYDVSASAHLTVPSQSHHARRLPGESSVQYDFSGRVSPPRPPLFVVNPSARSPERSDHVLVDVDVSPVSSGSMGSTLVGAMSGANDPDVQSWRNNPRAHYYSSRRR